MRGRGAGDQVVQVEFMEGGSSLEESRADDDARREAARARRLRWVGLAVMIALVGTIVAATVIDNRLDAARRAALAELGWVLPPLGGPLEEVWRASGGWVIGTAGDVILVQDETGLAIRALDAGTGAVQWEREGAQDESCFPLYDYRATLSRYPVSETLICVPLDMYAFEGLPDPGFTASLTAVDATSGADLGSLVVDGSVLVQDAVGDDLLLTYLDKDAGLGVVRWDPRSGEVWRYRSPPGVLPDGMSWRSDTGGWVYGLGDGVLQLMDDLALDLATGRETVVAGFDPVASFKGHVEVLPDGARAQWLWGSGIRGWSTEGRVLSADGTLRFEVEGEPWFVVATDGSFPDLLMTLRPDGSVAALDPTSGGELWSVPDLAEPWPVFLLEGVLLLSGPTTVSALDVRDGSILWELDTRFAINTTVPTDGDVVLVQVAERSTNVILAVHLRTGEEVWRMPGPGSSVYWEVTSTPEGHFVLLGDEELIGLR
jgi:outer membrane protein assembly factor BamB